MMWVVVASSTVPRCRSSSASSYSKLVLPPLPITAVSPFSIPSNSQSRAILPPPIFPILPYLSAARNEI